MLKSAFVSVVFLLIIFSNCFGQDSILLDLTYEINKIYPAISVSKTDLGDAVTLAEFHRFYQSDCNAKEYYSVEIQAMHNGVTKSEKGINDTLTLNQKELILNADSGSDIKVKVDYLPNNTMSNNEARVYNFTFSIHPDNDAMCTVGDKQLIEYIKQNAIDKIPEGLFKNYDLVTIKFTVSEKGSIVNPHVHWPSKHKEAEKMLMDAISNMPPWQPASYSDGTKVEQEFVLTVGNHESCVINTLNIEAN